MKNRKRQRENRRYKEEKLNMRRETGVLDPTPYYAVLNMRSGNFYNKNHKPGLEEGGGDEWIMEESSPP